MVSSKAIGKFHERERIRTDLKEWLKFKRGAEERKHEVRHLLCMCPTLVRVPSTICVPEHYQGSLLNIEPRVGPDHC